MSTGLEARLTRLEQRAQGEGLCTDPQCLHMEILRLNRRVNGLPEYPLPPHPRVEPGYSLVRELSSLNRQPGESVEAYAERMRPRRERYVDPYTGALGRPINDEGDLA